MVEMAGLWQCFLFSNIVSADAPGRIANLQGIFGAVYGAWAAEGLTDRKLWLFCGLWSISGKLV